MESTYYHNRCIDLLIRALAQPPETYNPVILAAAVISCLYEELDVDADTQQYHLSGTRNLLRHETVARFTRECDFAEAVSWVYLRQAIYVCIVRRQPIDIPLEVFETFTAFSKEDDSSYANRVVYIFAKLLRAFFPEKSGDTTVCHSCRDWEALERELDLWYDNKPVSFEPPYEENPDFEAGRPFPFIWMVSTVSGASAIGPISNKWAILTDAREQWLPCNTTTRPKLSFISTGAIMRTPVRVSKLRGDGSVTR